jgi:hypothetical protein
MEDTTMNTTTAPVDWDDVVNEPEIPTIRCPLGHEWQHALGERGWSYCPKCHHGYPAIELEVVTNRTRLANHYFLIVDETTEGE